MSNNSLRPLTQERSPLPFTAVEVHHAGRGSELVIGFDDFSVAKPFGTTPEARMANAEFIVRACNAHNALVEALRAVDAEGLLNTSQSSDATVQLVLTAVAVATEPGS